MIRIALAVLVLVSFVDHARAADPIKIPFKVVEAAFKKAECTAELKDELRETVEDLGGRLKLVEIRCWSAAYQGGAFYLVVDPAAPEKARLLRFQYWSRKRLIWVHSLTDPGYDPETKKLASYHKGRGVGDCGSIGEWKWMGTDFKLAGFWQKDKCDGQPFDDDKRWQVFPPRR